MDTELNRRLALIETYLLYWGRLRRKDICRHFDIGPVTATRVLKSYTERHPKNIQFSVSGRCYVPGADFKTQYETPVEDALSLLAYGSEVRQFTTQCYGPQKISSFTAKLVDKKVAPITRAMVASAGIEVDYISGSGEKSRIVYPHAIFEGGAAWYFRAYDIMNQEFRTFRFSRVTKVRAPKNPKSQVSSRDDKEWSEIVTLTLAPHTKHPSRDSLAMDLGLENRPVKNVQVRKALAGFVLIDLRVDCSSGGSLDPFQYPLELQNIHELTGIESMALAPGFRPT